MSEALRWARDRSNYQEPDSAQELSGALRTAHAAGGLHQPVRVGTVRKEPRLEVARSTASPIAATTTASARRRAMPGAHGSRATRASTSAASRSRASRPTTPTTARRDQDTDFTPDLLFEQREEDEAWQTYEELALRRRARRGAGRAGSWAATTCTRSSTFVSNPTSGCRTSSIATTTS